MIESETATQASAEALAELQADLEQVGFKPFWGDWLASDPTMPAQPRTQVVPHVWRAADYLPRLGRASKLVDTTLAERRSVMLMNPGLAGKPSQPITRPLGDGQYRYGAGLIPTWERHLAPYSPLFHYSWDRAYTALREIARTDPGSPFDAVLLEYTNPCTGGAALPTMATRLQMLPPGTHTRAHRHTASTVYLTVRGRGRTIVDGMALDWSEHDLFVVPTWAWHEHLNEAAEEAILFSFTDEPTLRALALYREEDRR
jgi:gentisate 1,2-dioxygenase